MTPGRRGALGAAVALALAADLFCLNAAVHGGIAVTLGFARLRVHDPAGPMAGAALLAGTLVALGWRRGRAASLVAFVAAGTAAAALLSRAGALVYPLADVALIELYTREAAAGRLVVGMYSRFGWHHPGPMYFYMLAPLYSVAGHNTAALCAAALALALAAVAATVWTTARYAGWTLSAALLAAIGICLWRVGALIDSPWTPHVVVLPAIGLIAVCAAVAGGAVGALPVAALLATFLAQTHVAVAPFAAGLLATGLAAGAVAVRGDPSGRARLRAALTRTAWALALTWFLPAAESAAHAGGNIVALAQFFGRQARGQSFAAATGVWADGLTAPLRAGFDLAYGRSVSPALSADAWLAVALVVGAAATAAWAFRARSTGLAWMGAFACVGSLITFWSATRMPADVNDHFAFWFASAGLVDAAVIAAAGATWIASASAGAASAAERLAPLAHGALLGAILLLGLQQVNRARQGSIPITVLAPSVATFDGSIRQYLDREHVRRPLFRIAGARWDLAAGMLQELHREGVPFAVEESWMPMFPERFRATGDEDAVLTVAGVFEAPELALRPGNVTIERSSQARVDAVRIVRDPNR